MPVKSAREEDFGSPMAGERQSSQGFHAPFRAVPLCRGRLRLVDKLVSAVASDGRCRGPKCRFSGGLPCLVADDAGDYRLLAVSDFVSGHGEHLRFLFLGMALFSTNFALFYNASLYLASGLLAVILSMSSLINVAARGSLINRRPPPLMQVVAAIVGLVGLGLIFAPEFKTLPTAGIAVAYGVSWRHHRFSFCIGNLLSSDSQRNFARGVRGRAASVILQPAGAWCMAPVCSWGNHCLFARPSLHHRHVAQLSVAAFAWLINVHHLIGDDQFRLLSQPCRADRSGPRRLRDGRVPGLRPADFGALRGI